MKNVHNIFKIMCCSHNKKRFPCEKRHFYQFLIHIMALHSLHFSSLTIHSFVKYSQICDLNAI